MKEYNLPILLLCFGVARTAWFPAERKKIISDCLIKMKELCLTPMLEPLYKDWHPKLQLILTHLFLMLADLRKKKRIFNVYCKGTFHRLCLVSGDE